MEEVVNAELLPEELGSMEEASLHNTPSRGHNYKGEVLQDTRR